MIKVKTFYEIDLEKSVTQATADITNGLLDESGVITTFEPTKVKTLLGENNIYSNCGDVEVEYFTEKSDGIAELIKAFM